LSPAHRHISSRALAALLPLLAVAACQTDKKPITGFDMQPPGSIVQVTDGNTESGGLVIWPVFAMDTQQTFRFRLNGQDLVSRYGQDGQRFYDYQEWTLGPGWTGSAANPMSGIPPATYVVELVDSAGQSWGRSAPLGIPASTFLSPGPRPPAVMFAHFDGQAGSWTIDPATQDADPATDEITVTNLLTEDVVVERCLIASGVRTSCTPVGTLAPAADLPTVETMTSASPTDDHQILFIHLASDADQSYQRDLIRGNPLSGACEIERILVHGKRRFSPNQPASIVTAFALSSCFGYSNGPQN